MQLFFETGCHSKLVVKINSMNFATTSRFRVKDDCPAFRGQHGVKCRLVPQNKKQVPHFEANRLSKRVIALATENREHQDRHINITGDRSK